MINIDDRGIFFREVKPLEEFQKWCKTVTDQVRFRPDRAAIARELQAHYEDHVKDLERIGFDSTLAEERALAAMGDAEQIGRAMDRAHKPWLGWLWTASRIGLFLGIALAIVCLLFYGWRKPYPAQRSGDYEPDGYFYFGDEWKAASPRVRVGRGDQAVIRGGLEISVPYAALWEREYELEGMQYTEYWTTIVLAVDDRNPINEQRSNFLEHMTVTFDDGTIYSNDYYDYTEDAEGNVVLGADGYLGYAQNGSDPLRAVYYLRTSPRLEMGEWLELSYPYGEPWTIRVNWEEALP